MKKGFTLVELLAVLVILAIIALIATPIILGFVNDMKRSAKLKTTEFYIDAVNQAVVRERMNGIKIKSTTCNINSDGNLLCEGIDGVVRIDSEGDMPVSGTVVIENGLVKNVTDTLIVYEDNTEVGFTLYGEMALGDRSVNLAQYIISLYNEGTLSNSLSVDGITYKLNKEKGLMDDRLGGSIGSGGNIRYYGQNPNNYIDIGDRDSSGNVILWRIIGVFKDMQTTNSSGKVTGKSDLVKIVRADSIGNYSRDYTSTGRTNNNWSTATLNTMLNGAYYNSTTTNYYNNSTTPTTVNFTSSGLSDIVKDDVQSVVWNLGGYQYSTFKTQYTNDWYKLERGTEKYGSNPTTWSGKVALMYPSDYGYATDLARCNKYLYNYQDDTNSYACKTNNWIYNGDYQWFLTPNATYSNNTSGVNLHGAGNNYYAYRVTGVKPTLYLKADAGIIEGKGTTDKPYIMKQNTKLGSFETDSWDTIVKNVKEGNISNYNVGDTKEITLTSTDTDIAGTYTVRIANTSTPEECNTTGFSQTACGFVIEFVDVISEYMMNETTGNAIGGWQDSEMRSYVNNNIYNSFPTELKNGIIDTLVTSGATQEDDVIYFETTDKLYLLSPKEIYGVEGSSLVSFGTSLNDSAENETRQLDYYKMMGVSQTNYSDAIKVGTNIELDEYRSWSLRSPIISDYLHFYGVSSNGSLSYDVANDSTYVAPAFRIG